MEIFKNLFSANKKKRQYIGTWEVNLANKEVLEGLLATLVVSEESAKTLFHYTQLDYNEAGLLENASIYVEGKLETNININKGLGLEQAKGILMYRDVPLHNIYQFAAQPNGLHQFGGEVPKELTMPNDYFVAPILYLGYINSQDPIFSWLRHPLHIVCPLHMNFDAIYMDYSNPLAPRFLNYNELDPEDCPFDGFTADSDIVYHPIRFNLEPYSDYGTSLGRAGAPKWTQRPATPRCPKSGKFMRFVFQSHFTGVNAMRNNVIPESEDYRQYYDELFIDGYLYLFFEPETNVACYIAQYG
jgi:hypothetical protein